MKEEHCYCKYQPLRSEDLLINKEADIWRQFLVHWAGCFISKCEEELVHDEKKSNSNYFIYSISNIAFLHVAEKKNCTRFLTCHSTRQIM